MNLLSSFFHPRAKTFIIYIDFLLIVRVIQHSGFYLTQLLIVGCVFCSFSVVLFGLDGALVSFEAFQWICKVILHFQRVQHRGVVALKT